jgi:hypothetical protein
MTAMLILSMESIGLATTPSPLAEADAILQNPALTVSQAQEALAIYESLLPGALTDRGALLLRLTRSCVILGDLLEGDNSQRRPYFEKGQVYAKLLAMEEPGTVAGPYWLGLNLAGEAASKGIFGGRALLSEILQELQRAMAIDEGYDEAGPPRALGRLYYLIPGPPLAIGDPKKSLEYLTETVRLAPENSSNHLYLAETLIRLGEKEQARQELVKVFSATHHALMPRDLEKDRRKARQLLSEMDGASN